MVGKHHATVKPDSSVAPREMKTYSESRIELRNLKILKKMLGKSSHFFSSEQPCKLKSLNVALKVAGVENKYPRKTCSCGQPRGHLIRVLNERSVNDGGDFCLVVGESQISLIWCWRHILVAILFTVSCG